MSRRNASKGDIQPWRCRMVGSKKVVERSVYGKLREYQSH